MQRRLRSGSKKQSETTMEVDGTGGEGQTDCPETGMCGDYPKNESYLAGRLKEETETR